MQIEIPSEERISQVEMLEKNGNHYTFTVDGRAIDLDVVMVEDGAYSILYKGKSYNVETIPGLDPKKYVVNTIYTRYEVELVDAATLYQRARTGDDGGAGDSKIIVPMPGKIVKVLAVPGQQVTKGETLVIVSAMKMESEYKAGKDGLVQEVLVAEGDTVDSGQTMIVID